MKVAKVALALLILIVTGIQASTDIRDQKAVEERFTFQSRRELCGSDTDTLVRHGVIVRREQAKGILFMMHGFMCCHRDIKVLRVLFPEYHIVQFDFRAHGDDIHDQACSFGYHEAEDVRGAVKAISQMSEFAHLPRYAYGFSMGAVATIMAQAHDETLFKALILDCPFEATDGVLDRALEGLKFSFFGCEFNVPGRCYMKEWAYHPYAQTVLKRTMKVLAKVDTTEISTAMVRFSPAEYMERINVPVFLISCLSDKKAPVYAIMQVYEHARKAPYKRLWITAGDGHFRSVFYQPEEYARRIHRFLDAVAQGKTALKAPAKIYYD